MYKSGFQTLAKIRFCSHSVEHELCGYESVTALPTKQVSDVFVEHFAKKEAALTVETKASFRMPSPEDC